MSSEPLRPFPAEAPTTFETGLSPVTLDPRIAPYRVPDRPQFARGLGFERGFDYFTLFYDVFADEDPDWILALGPPLPAQLQSTGGLSFRCANTGERLQADYVSPEFRWSTGYFRIHRKRRTDAISIQLANQHVFCAIQPNLSHLFSGRRVLLAKNRDNPLEWIVDWARYHALHFGIDAVLLFDNGSTLYESADIRRALSQVPGLDVIIVVDWPFPYHAPGANGWLRAYGRWSDSGFLETGWRRFLLSAGFVAHLDIDELIVQRSTRGLDNIIRDTACASLRLQSQDIVAWPEWGSQLPRHRQFSWATAPRDNWRPKWIVVPNRCPTSARWWIHQIEGAACFPVDRDEFRIAHFLPLTTGWGGRSGRRKVVDLNPSEHHHDAELQQRLDEAFNGWEPACRTWHPVDSGDANLIRACAQEAYASGKLEEAAVLLAEAMMVSPYHHGQHLLLREILAHFSTGSAREGEWRMNSAGSLAPVSTDADSRPDVEHAKAAIARAMADEAEIDLSWFPNSASRSWAMAEDGLRFLTRLIRAVRPGHVIEFGSGVSTALLLRESHEGRLGFHVTSIEHDPRYARETMRIVSDRILLPTFALSVAPLVGRVIRGRFSPTYYTKEIVPASSEPADLVLVDGPPSALGGRFGSIIQGLAASRRGAIVVIDDSARSGEQQALQAITDGFADAVEVHHLAGFKRGMAVLIVRDPGPFASITTAWEPNEVPFQGDIGHQSDTFSRYAGRLSLTAEHASVPDGHRRPAQIAPNGPGTTGGPMVIYVVGGLARKFSGAEARDFPLLTRDPQESKRAHAKRFSRLVEAAMAFGGTHLVVPRAHADWLAGHPHLIDYLKANHELVDADPESGLTFQLLERG